MVLAYQPRRPFPSTLPQSRAHAELTGLEATRRGVVGSTIEVAMNGALDAELEGWLAEWAALDANGSTVAMAVTSSMMVARVGEEKAPDFCLGPCGAHQAHNLI